MGRDVNIGAGTITCNYDGANKHRTIIEDDVHIGSDTQLVAPVRCRQGRNPGAGTTLTRDAPEGALTISRAKQVTVPGWKRPVKKRSIEEKKGVTSRCAASSARSQSATSCPILIEGLRRLEYRGYDSCGVAVS